MTEYDYSPEAYERYLATQSRIARWVDETEQHRPQFQHAVQHHHSRRHRPTQIYLQPPTPPDDSASSSDDDVSIPAAYPAQPQPRYPAPPVSQPLLSPPPMMQMVYPTPAPQRSPYYGYPAAPAHHRSSSRSHAPHHSPTYYGMATSPQVSPPYPHQQQQFVYPPPPSANPHPHPAYVFVPQHHHPKPPHQPVVYLRA